MENTKPTYYAFIPAEVRYSDKLKSGEKLLFAEICALSNEKGYCYASNAYFARLYNNSIHTISLWLNNLEANNFISRSLMKDDKHRFARRVIYVQTLCTESTMPHIQKSTYPMDENCTHNIIRDITPRDTTLAITNKKEKSTTQFDDIINTFTDDMQLQDTIREFIKMRKAIRKPATSKALELILQRLTTLSTNSDTQRIILEQSIINSWQGVYPLKEYNNSREEKKTDNIFLQMLMEEEEKKARGEYGGRVKTCYQ